MKREHLLRKIGVFYSKHFLKQEDQWGGMQEQEAAFCSLDALYAVASLTTALGPVISPLREPQIMENLKQNRSVETRENIQDNYGRSLRDALQEFYILLESEGIPASPAFCSIPDFNSSFTCFILLPLK